MWNNPQSGPRYINLDKGTLKLVVYSDGSFATNNGGSSQMGYLLFMADEKQQSQSNWLCKWQMEREWYN